MTQREIKFRIFSERFNEYKMVPVTGMLVQQDGVWFQADDPGQGRKRTYHISSGRVMQFTGLRDKNGTEIYEKDLVTFRGSVWTVEWEGAGFGLSRPGHPGYLLESHMDGLTVIGNALENPDLLTDASTTAAQTP